VIRDIYYTSTRDLPRHFEFPFFERENKVNWALALSPRSGFLARLPPLEKWVANKDSQQYKGKTQTLVTEIEKVFFVYFIPICVPNIM
jgi:hypothetical protein